MGDFSIKDFAELYSLDIWDWFAAIIAVSSLIIAISSLVIACKTLKSQKETQKNTAPIITINIQEMLWISLLQKIHNNIRELVALQLLLKKNKYKVKPHESFIKSFCVPVNDFVHEELFYNNELFFSHVHKLKEELFNFNNYFLSIANHLDNNIISSETIERMKIYIDNLGSTALNFYLRIFLNNDKSQLDKLINRIFIDMDFYLDENGNPFWGDELHNKDLKYSDVDVFISFFKSIDEDKYNRFKTAYYESINLYANFLISTNKIVLTKI